MPNSWPLTTAVRESACMDRTLRGAALNWGRRQRSASEPLVSSSHLTPTPWKPLTFSDRSDLAEYFSHSPYTEQWKTDVQHHPSELITCPMSFTNDWNKWLTCSLEQYQGVTPCHLWFPIKASTGTRWVPKYNERRKLISTYLRE